MATLVTTYFFDQTEVRPAQRQVLVAGQAAPLGPRAFDVLLALIERRERTVPKQELLDAVWPGVYVEEHNLVVQVGNLRKLFGSGTIATVPGRGYRFTAILSDKPATEPPAACSALPDALPTVIGRDEDLAAINELMPLHRLVSLVGAGGIGKTRIAQRLIAERRGLYAHGVGWVELAALTDGAEVPGAIARALGLEISQSDRLSNLVAALRPMSLLLALDNAEHLTAGVSSVVDALISGTTGVRVIVTSQVPLGHEAEQVVRLEPLRLPPAGATAAEAMQYGAAALFVQRAQSADRRFAMNDDNAAAVIDICHRLDGIALALEMAAARVPLFGVKGLAAALHDQLRVLSSKRRDGPMRHQTLHATLEWSHRLLPAQEQIVLRRLSVFAGSFSLELAQEVVHGTGTEAQRWALLDALGNLADRSLLVADACDPPRYHLLECTRAYAREQLVAAGEDHAWQERHARAIRRYLTQVFAERVTAFDPAVSRLEREIDNARQAFTWARRHDAETAVALAHPFALAMGEHARAFSNSIWDATEPLLDDTMPAAVRADWALGASLWNHADTHSRAHWAQTAARLSREIGDTNQLIFSLMAIVKARPGTHDDEQRAAFEELKQLNDPSRPAGLRLRAMLAEGNILSMSGEQVRAQQMFKQALQLSTQACDSLAACGVLLSAIDAELAAGQIDEAVRHGIDLVERVRATRCNRLLTVALFDLCAGQLLQGAASSARATAGEAWPLARAFNLQVHFCNHLALLAALEGRAEAAMQLLGCADARHARLALERQAHEKRMTEQLRRIAREHLSHAEAERLHAQGADMGDHDIQALAFAETATR
jgi:predicted ATPase